MDLVAPLLQLQLSHLAFGFFMLSLFGHIVDFFVGFIFVRVIFFNSIGQNIIALRLPGEHALIGQLTYTAVSQPEKTRQLST